MLFELDAVGLLCLVGPQLEVEGLVCLGGMVVGGDLLKIL